MKKTLAIIMAMALLCIMAVGTTLSYFTDTDGDKNVMTVGKVGITQTINGQNTGVAATTKLFPAVFNGTTINNAVDMNVVVTLDAGSEAAYVRTVYAFEMMKVGNELVDPLQKDGNNVATIYCVADQALTAKNVVIYKNDEGYSVNAEGATAAYAIYVSATAKLTANGTLESLKQIYLDKTVGNEFSDAVDGSYEILVLSQAVQAQGFGDDAAAAMTAAFGAVDATNAAKWFNEMPTP